MLLLFFSDSSSVSCISNAQKATSLYIAFSCYLFISCPNLQKKASGGDLLPSVIFVLLLGFSQINCSVLIIISGSNR